MFFVRWQRREWKGTVPFKSRVFYMTSFLWCFGWYYWFCFWRISFATLGTETDGYDGLGWLGTQTDVAIKDEETDGYDGLEWLGTQMGVAIKDERKRSKSSKPSSMIRFLLGGLLLLGLLLLGLLLLGLLEYLLSMR